MLPGTILPPPFHPAARAAAAQRARGSPPLVIDDSDTELPSIRGHAYGSRQAAGRPRVEEVDEDADAAFARRLMEEEEAAVRRMQERREAAAAAAAANSDQVRPTTRAACAAACAGLQAYAYPAGCPSLSRNACLPLSHSCCAHAY
jgi:hypothetical protein